MKYSLYSIKFAEKKYVPNYNSRPFAIGKLRAMPYFYHFLYSFEPPKLKLFISRMLYTINMYQKVFNKRV